MTRKYMDFAPVRRQTVKKTVVSRVPMNAVPRSRVGMRPVASKRVAMVSAGKRTVNTGTRQASRNYATTTEQSHVKLGEIEDLNPQFVTTNVPKRPLNDGTKKVVAQDNAKVIKQKKVGGRLKAKKANKVVAKQERAQRKVASKEAYAVPKSPFINQDKVTKRPLSRNVYQAQQKKVVAPTEKKTDGKPVTIIAKPKKDSKVGLVVTIILTIILGAVAGTVAFLLLPK